MNIKFKEIEEQDLLEVKKTYDWYILNSTATFHTEPIQIDQLKEFIYINHPLYKSYLIFENDKIAGYCLLTNYKKRQAYNRTAEVTIYLRPEFCGKGIGKFILNYLEEIAKKKGLKNLIGIISGDNVESISLFEKSGYEKCAHFKNMGEKFNKILDVVAYQKEI
ncbi:Sortase-like acyltransferase [uncultured Paludibacter sp.]|uniref:Sortase-like acyltransferase n=1 Tax=uncultured Paludibacter sp. TaxID=497635 RepID=A0A653AJ48_9BACT|nr:Sortase-like acyltransferase [uncultured Paludibacter sp.]